MNQKIQTLISSFRKHQIDAYLVTKDINISYLTDFPASESWLFITPKKTMYITDFRYVLEAQRGLKGIHVKRYTKSIFDTLREIATKHRIERIGFDDRHVSLSVFKKLKKSSGHKLRFLAKNNLVESLRVIKGEKEITLIRKALDLNIKAYEFLKNIIKGGMSEKMVLRHLERFIKSEDASFSFPPIIASGPNSCLPHAKVTDRIIQNNDLVLVDMGIDIQGYKSDLTRIFFLGRIPSLIKKVYSWVYEAQQKAIRKIQPGISTRDIDQEARNSLKKSRLDRFFGHSLGHGVGLEIHEDPTISSNSLAVIKEKMVFTVEPAIYLPNRFGIRIEDMVLVTKNGCEVLSTRLTSHEPFILS